jgi:hypothetical protein
LILASALLAWALLDNWVQLIVIPTGGKLADAGVLLLSGSDLVWKPFWQPIGKLGVAPWSLRLAAAAMTLTAALFLLSGVARSILSRTSITVDRAILGLSIASLLLLYGSVHASAEQQRSLWLTADPPQRVQKREFDQVIEDVAILQTSGFPIEDAIRAAYHLQTYYQPPIWRSRTLLVWAIVPLALLGVFHPPGRRRPFQRTCTLYLFSLLLFASLLPWKLAVVVREGSGFEGVLAFTWWIVNTPSEFPLAWRLALFSVTAASLAGLLVACRASTIGDRTAKMANLACAVVATCGVGFLLLTSVKRCMDAWYVCAWKELPTSEPAYKIIVLSLVSLFVLLAATGSPAAQQGATADKPQRASIDP